MQYSLEPIGVFQSCFKDKFGIPRQPGLVPESFGVIKLRDEDFLRRAVKGLDGFSHLWVIFIFHKHDAKNWKPSVRPPRLGGARKIGVLASRSPHRPNPIGLSVVAVDRIEVDAKGGVEIYVSGIDVLDGSPVLDIKPYIPYADAVPDARAGWAQEPIQKTEVVFTPQAEKALEVRSGVLGPRLKSLIQQLLELDPRPAFQKRQSGTHYGFSVLDYDVKWEIRDGRFYVTDVVDL